MKPVLMDHPKSVLTIMVPPGQVENAVNNGWSPIEPDQPAIKSKAKKKVKNDGKSKR
jgi:hypothetical protein